MTTVDQVRERAVRRTRRWAYFLPAVYALVSVLSGIALGTSTGEIVFSAGMSLLGAGVALVIWSRAGGGVIPRRAPLRAGLPLRGRRAVRRAIRRGEPSLDPLLREIEIVDAGVMARTYGWLAIGCAALIGWAVRFMVIDDLASTRTHLFDLGVLLLGTAGIAWLLASWFCSRRYLSPLTR